MKLATGKIPVDLLKEIVFENLGIEREEVILGPSAGIDGAIIEVGRKALIISMDPITGATERIGWLAVNVNANDVATFGVEPSFFFSCILLPEDSDRDMLGTICTQMNTAAKELQMAIVGGHCEVTLSFSKPVIVGCALGVTEKGKYVTAKGGKPGDKLILTKSLGIEGTAIIASDKEEQLKKTISSITIEEAKNFFRQISVVEDALTAYKAGGVHAMHDPTEGGVAGGIHEMTDASNLGVRVFEEEILVQRETLEICTFFKIDPFQLISSGALLISADPLYADKIMMELRQKRIEASVIGEFLKEKKRLFIQKDGTPKPLVRPLHDQLWKALKKQ